MIHGKILTTAGIATRIASFGLVIDQYPPGAATTKRGGEAMPPAAITGTLKD